MSLTDAISIDCEMVGIGHRGLKDMLARVSIVNEFSQCVYDKFVYPREKVIDYRTKISGVRPQDMLLGEKFNVVQEAVRNMIKGRWLVGHSVDHDLEVLELSHPASKTWDSATHPPFLKMNKNRTPSLRWLARRVLSRTIQNGEHSSVVDAKACMDIYKSVKNGNHSYNYSTDHDNYDYDNYLDYNDDHYEDDNFFENILDYNDDHYEDDYFYENILDYNNHDPYDDWYDVYGLSL